MSHDMLSEGKGNLSNLDQNYPTLCFMIPHEKAGPAWFMSKQGCFFYETIYKNIKTMQTADIRTNWWELCALWQFLNFHSAAHNHLLRQ